MEGTNNAEKTHTEWGRVLIWFGGLIFGGCVVALHWLSPEYLPARHSLSQYVSGEFGFLMTIAYLALAGAFGAAAYRVIVELPEEASAKFGAFLLLLSGLSFLFVAVLQADPGDAAISFAGKVHAYSLRSGVFVFWLGAVLISFKMRALAGLSGWLPLISSVGMTALYTWQQRAPEGLGGWQQRALFGGIFLWLAVVASAKKARDLASL